MRVSVTPRPLFTHGKDPVPIVQEAGWVPGPVWTGAKNLASTGIQSPDRPAHSQSLYRLSYPAHTVTAQGQDFTPYLLNTKTVATRRNELGGFSWVTPLLPGKRQNVRLIVRNPVVVQCNWHSLHLKKSSKYALQCISDIFVNCSWVATRWQ